jgi:HEPN domain-containing protein
MGLEVVDLGLYPLDDNLLSGFRHMVEIFSELEMPVSKRDAEALLQMYERREERPLNDVSLVISTLYSSIVSEFEGRCVIAIGLQGAKLYEPKEPCFGQQVTDKFGSVIYEIDEAAKCLALGRSTASAFHSIRSLEAAIRAISRCLGISDPTKAADRSWFKLLNVIKSEIDRRWPTSSNRLSGDGKFFEEAYGALAAMQNPYRNATMHLDQKYTEEEAKHIFEIVKGFMRKLASRCDENGDPKA